MYSQNKLRSLLYSGVAFVSPSLPSQRIGAMCRGADWTDYKDKFTRLTCHRRFGEEKTWF